MLDLAEVALEPARGLAGGGDHDVEEGGVGHQSVRRARTVPPDTGPCRNALPPLVALSLVCR
jgi:hypothetical protein